MTWPNYSPACVEAGASLLREGKPLSGYRSNKEWGVKPQEWSWASKFEREMQARWNVPHAIAMNSGTMALKAAIYALNLPPGSKIITTPYSFSATPASITLMGHIPVFADVDEYEYTLDPDSVRKVFTKDIAAIMPVDLFGCLSDYEALREFGVPIISDHCQAVGTSVNGKYTFGNITACSGNGGKNLPCGEGGWCLTDDPLLAERMRLFISHGENFDSPDCGENGRMPELTALVAWHGLVELKERNRQRHRLATRLTNALFDSKIYRIPSLYSCTEEDQEHAWYVYPFQVAPGTRDEFIKKLKAKGVGCGAGYMTPGLNDFKAFCQYPSVETKAVDRLSNQTLCIITDLTPDRPVEFATEVARKMRDCLS